MTTTSQLTKAFLESKSFSCLSAWGGGKQKVPCTASSGNIHRISDEVLRFTVHNFLPTSHDGETYAKEDVLDGHFTFYVNFNTFEYLAYKSSDYRNFVSVTPVEFNGFYDKDSLPEISRKRVESVIAHKLLGAYFQDPNAVNRKGANLIEPQPAEPAGNGFNEGIMRHPGCKMSLICDYRGYMWTDYKVETLCEADLVALEQLQGWTPPEVPELPDDLLKSLRSKLQGSKGKARSVDFEFAGFSLRLVHYINPIHGRNTILCTPEGGNAGNFITQEFTEHSLTKFIKCIPTILRNYSSQQLSLTHA
jgi:hypothetical protein